MYHKIRKEETLFAAPCPATWKVWLNMIMIIDSREHDVMVKSQQSQHEKATWQCNMAEALEATTKDVDLFRETPVRLLGMFSAVIGFRKT